MIAYGFQPHFAPQITTGAPDPKTLTLRRFRKPPSRHVNVGEPMGLWTGMRSKAAQRRGVGICVLRAIVRFGARGILITSDLRVHQAEDEFAAALSRELLDCAHDAIAQRDGFENWAAAWAWHDAHREQEERNEATLVREAIAWRPLTIAQISAIEQGAALEGVG